MDKDVAAVSAEMPEGQVRPVERWAPPPTNAVFTLKDSGGFGTKQADPKMFATQAEAVALRDSYLNLALPKGYLLSLALSEKEAQLASPDTNDPKRQMWEVIITTDKGTVHHQFVMELLYAYNNCATQARFKIDEGGIKVEAHDIVNDPVPVIPGHIGGGALAGGRGAQDPVMDKLDAILAAIAALDVPRKG